MVPDSLNYLFLLQNFQVITTPRAARGFEPGTPETVTQTFLFLSSSCVGTIGYQLGRYKQRWVIYL